MSHKRMLPALESYTLVSEDTGEIKESSITGRVPKEKEFFALMFVSNIMMLKNQAFTKKQKILALALLEMNHDNIVYIMTSFKLKASNLLNVKPGYVDNMMKEFLEEGLCERLNRGEYVMNPYYFGKGSLSHVKKLRFMFDQLKSESNEDVIQYKITRTYEQIDTVPR